MNDHVDQEAVQQEGAEPKRKREGNGQKTEQQTEE